MRACGACRRSCSALSPSDHGKTTIRCSRRSTSCASFTQAARRNFRRIRRRVSCGRYGASSSRPTPELERQAYEVAVMMALRERLRSGDVWVEGSRAFRAFDDFLLPRDVFDKPPEGRRVGPRRSAIVSRIGATRKQRFWKLAFARSTSLAAAANCPRPRSPRKACRSAPFARMRTRRRT